jgi:hypothetical protein
VMRGSIGSSRPCTVHCALCSPHLLRRP